MHCLGIAYARLFTMGWTSAEGQKIECFKWMPAFHQNPDCLYVSTMISFTKNVVQMGVLHKTGDTICWYGQKIIFHVTSIPGNCNYLQKKEIGFLYFFFQPIVSRDCKLFQLFCYRLIFYYWTLKVFWAGVMSLSVYQQSLLLSFV